MGTQDEFERYNELVTAAIVSMDHAYGRGPHPLPPEGRAFGRYVSHVEEAIARCAPPGSVDEACAKAGAIEAAMRAMDPLRAIRLSIRYLQRPQDTEMLAYQLFVIDFMLSLLRNWLPDEPPRGARLLTW